MSGLKWFRGRHRGAACSILPVSRFVDDKTFATKNGGYGVGFRLKGLDDEGLTAEHLSSISTRLAAALRVLPEESTFFQYVVRERGYQIPLRSYEETVVRERIHGRVDFLHRTAGLGTVSLVWMIYVHPSARLAPKDRAKKSGQLLRNLKTAARLFQEQLADLFPMEMMTADAIGEFFSYLLTLDRNRVTKRLRSWNYVDRQLPAVTSTWHEGYLKFGRRFAQPFSLIASPAGTKPNLFGDLLSLDANVVLCSSWAAKTTAATRKEVKSHEGFLGMFSEGLLKVVSHAAANQQMRESAAAKSAHKSTDKLGDIVNEIENAGRRYGHYSLFGLVHGESLEAIREVLPQVHKIFQDPSEAKILEEELGAMSAYYSLFPGNEKFNVRRRWLQDIHYSNLSFGYASNEGNLTSDALEDEYLAVYETRRRQPFFFDPYVNGLRGLLILGAPGRGKSVNGNFLIANEQKYGGFTYIFDVGGSYEGTVLLSGGVSTRIGLDGPRVNPFILEPTEENLQFLFRFVRLLLAKSGVVPTAEEENELAEKVRLLYALPERSRRLKNLVLPLRLQPGLAKWIQGGVYGTIFDNVEDTLHLAKVQCFDFQDIGKDHEDLLEPILFWIIRRTNSVIHDPANLGVPKHLLFDEIWKQLKNPQMLEMVLLSLKTGRKNLAGVTLLTHLVDDLGEHASLIKNACPMTMFLGDPTFDREAYRTFFDLNEKELDNIASLKPRELLLKRPDYSKILVLNLDPKSYWSFTTKAKDRAKRLRAVEEHGYEKALDVLAREVA